MKINFKEIYDWIKIYTIIFAISLLFCFIAYLFNQTDFIKSFLNNNLIVIQVTLLAINIPSLCILLNNVVTLVKDYKMNKKEIEIINFSFLIKRALYEEIIYIILGFISLIILNSLTFTNNITIYKVFFLCLTMSWFLMSIASTVDVFKAILNIYQISINKKSI